MNTEPTVDREDLLDYLVLEAAERPCEVGEQFAVIAESIENELEPALRQLGAGQPPSPYEGEDECRNAVTKLAYLPHLPFTESGAVRFLREYELEEELGSGGMGTVYRAKHTKLGKSFALKVLSPRLPNSPHAVSRFLREMRAAGKIDHQNVVCATDAGEVEGIHYLVMELVDGLNLSQLVKAVGPLALADACEITRLGALGLHAIHTHGLVHRDVKPSNLILGRPESQIPRQKRVDSSQSPPDFCPTVKILDLGLALLHDASFTTEPGDVNRVVGTVQYMAPEQFINSYDVDARADLYGLGGTLHYLLTGRPPSPGDSQPTDSVEVTRILHRLMMHDPADRFASAADVASALEPLCEAADLKRLAMRARNRMESGTDGVASQSPLSDPVNEPSCDKFCGRRRARLFVAVCGLLIGFAVLATWSITRTRSGDAAISVNEPDVAISVHEPDVAVFAGDAEARERQLAEWVLQRGGGLKLYPYGDVTRLEDLPEEAIRIQNIMLGKQNLGDDDVSRFLGISNLQSLELSYNQLTDRSIEVLSQVTTLRWLYLYHNQDITDGAADDLAKLKNLELLDLRSTQITDKTIARLIHLPKLNALRLAYTQVTDQALPDLGKIPTLLRVDLSGTSVGDQNLFFIGELPGLRRLQLASTPISDDAVDILKRMANLSELDVRDTDLSPAAVEELRRALPNCEVIFGLPDHSE